MDFGIGDGVRIEGIQGSIDLAQQPNDVVKAAYEEAQRVGLERGLWVPAGAGSLAVASEAGAPSLRDSLLATAVEGAKLYIGAVNGINEKRTKKNRIPTLKPEEYRKRAEDWLTDDLEDAARQLPVAENRPRLVMPRLTRSITTEEIVATWRSAAGGKLWSWSGRMEFLKNWPADLLSGIGPETDEASFQIMPTAYDKAREGTVGHQSGNLRVLQTDYSRLRVASIFDGAILALRYMNQPRDWKDSYVRAINLKPVAVGSAGSVPDAYVDGDGYARVGSLNVQVGNAARLLAR